MDRFGGTRVGGPVGRFWAKMVIFGTPGGPDRSDPKSAETLQIGRFRCFLAIFKNSRQKGPFRPGQVGGQKWPFWPKTRKMAQKVFRSFA